MREGGMDHLFTLAVSMLLMDQLNSMCHHNIQECYHLMLCTVYVVWSGHHKLLIDQDDTETTTGQTQQLLIVLSATDVMWFVWHIVSVDKMNGWARLSGYCHSHEQKLY